MDARAASFRDYLKDLRASRATTAIVAVNLVVFAVLQARPDAATLFLLNPALDAVTAQPWTLLTVFFSHELAVHLLISLSAYSSWDDVFVDNMGIPEPLATAQRVFVRLYTGVKYGFDSRHIVPKRQIRELGDRPALLAHSTGDSQIPFASLARLAEQAPPRIETWVREGDRHFIVDDDSLLEPWNDPEYAGRIIGFLERNFGR